MSFESFMKANKKIKQNVFYAATKSLCDENGEPLLWELKPITSKESDAIREQCSLEVPIKGKPNQYRIKIDTSKYLEKIICAAIVTPNLRDTMLQNSYGVATPEDLLKEMVDDIGEYNALVEKIQTISGLTTLQEDVEEAKNS